MTDSQKNKKANKLESMNRFKVLIYLNKFTLAFLIFDAMI
jgi:hypothetical protein